jgi:putative FmdB family regulatory protein
MPTYEYDCRDCGGQVEFFQGLSEAPKRKCPRCGSPAGLRRRIGCGAGIIFRGSGFYETDYRRAPAKSEAKKEKETAEGSATDTKKESDSVTKKSAAKSTI